MSTEREACSRLIEQWEARARKAFPTDAMLINRHIRELHEALAQPVAADKFRELLRAEISATIDSSPGRDGHQISTLAARSGRVGCGAPRPIGMPTVAHWPVTAWNSDGDRMTG